VNQPGTCVTMIAGQPGELMHLVADGLVGNGFPVGLPEFDDGRRLSITSPVARCALSVEDCGAVVCDWNPVAGSSVDPLDLAHVASALLTGREGQTGWVGDGRRSDLTLKGKVGQELRARGLRVDLEVYPDDMSLEAHTAIVASAPEGSGDGQVRVSDDGRMSWERDYGAALADMDPDPDCTAGILSLGEVAAGIVAALTLALSQGPRALEDRLTESP
jgi:hypothetical protein